MKLKESLTKSETRIINDLRKKMYNTKKREEYNLIKHHIAMILKVVINRRVAELNQFNNK